MRRALTTFFAGALLGTAVATSLTAAASSGPAAPVHVESATRVRAESATAGRSYVQSAHPTRPTVTTAANAAPTGPSDITRGPEGNLWFTGVKTNGIRRITPRGRITLFSIPTPHSTPRRITRGPDGNLWFMELTEERIGHTTLSGRVTEYALPR